MRDDHKPTIENLDWPVRSTFLASNLRSHASGNPLDRMQRRGRHHSKNTCVATSAGEGERSGRRGKKAQCTVAIKTQRAVQCTTGSAALLLSLILSLFEFLVPRMPASSDGDRVLSLGLLRSVCVMVLFAKLLRSAVERIPAASCRGYSCALATGLPPRVGNPPEPLRKCAPAGPAHAAWVASVQRLGTVARRFLSRAVNGCWAHSR